MQENMNEANIINNEYDFSNKVIDSKYLAYLIKYLDGLNKQLEKMCEEDEEKNKQFKDEYKEYQYKSTYGQGFEAYIKFDNFSNNITCKDYASFESAVNNGKIINVKGIDIKLCMDFKRGSGNNLIEHENLFKIKIEPYDITLIRKSNHNDELINQIENQIVSMMNQFQTVNTIFCSK